MLKASCGARAALLESLLCQRKTMENGAAFWCCRPWAPDKLENWAGAKQMATVCVEHKRKSARKNPKKVGTFIDRLKKAAHYERTKTLRVQQRTGRSRNKKKTTKLVACIDRLKARFALKKYTGKRPQTVWGVGSQSTRYKEQLWNSNCNRQTRAAYSVRACAIETHMDKSQEPFLQEFTGKLPTARWSTLLKHRPLPLP